mgnify:CR=1 FL=1
MPSGKQTFPGVVAKAMKWRRSARVDHVQLGDQYRAQGCWQEASEAYARAVEQTPTWAEIWIQLGHAHKENGELDAAEAAYRRAISLDGRNIETVLHLAHVLKRKENYSESLRVFNSLKVSGVYDVDDEISYLQGVLASAGSDLREEAIVSPEWDQGQDQTTEQDLVAQGDLARDSARWAEAACFYQSVLSSSPERAGIWVQLAHCRKEDGRLVEAVEAYRKALALDGSNLETVLHLAHALKTAERLDEALVEFLKLQNSGAYDVDAEVRHIRSVLAKAQNVLPTTVDRQAGDDHSASPDVQEKISTAGEDYLRNGDRFRDAGEWDDAAAAYSAALAQDAGQADIWTQLGHCLKEGGRFQQAEIAYRKAYSLAPESDAPLHLAHVLKARGKHEQALVVFKEIQKAGLFDVDADIGALQEAGSPDLPVAHDRRSEETTDECARLIAEADRARDNRQWRVASEFYRKALDCSPNLRHVWVQYGHCLKEDGQVAEALIAYRQAHRLDECDPDPLLHLGYLEKAVGERDAAIASFRKLAALPGQSHIQEELQTLVNAGVGSVAIGEAGEKSTSASPVVAVVMLSSEVTGTASEYDYRIERLTAEGIRGWAVHPLRPDERFSVDILVGGLLYAQVPNSIVRKDLEKAGKSSTHGGFEIAFDLGLFDRGPVVFSIRLPDGHESGPVTVSAPVSVVRRVPAGGTQERSVSIVVPIYNAYDDVVECLNRLIAWTTAPARLILIDDASPDQRIGALLAKYDDVANIAVFRNERNIGFTRTVNRGLRYAGQDDVVLLNSDARVTPRWLDGLRAAIAADSRIGTATAMSDRAGAFSAPNSGNDNPLPFGWTEEDYAKTFRRESSALYPSVPTGNGFCLYVRRALIDEIGLFDEHAFPRGYGEENDFCMRAIRAGWRHVIDDRTYVFHERSKSFGEAKGTLLKAGRKVVDDRYPEYAKLISCFGTDPQLMVARLRARQALSVPIREGKKRHALFVLSTLSGGTPHTNQDLMQSLAIDWECWVLVCDSRTLTLSRLVRGTLVVVMRHDLSEPVNPVTYSSFEYDRVVAGWLGVYEFDVVHMRHLGWHSLSLPRLARESGAGVVMSLHDFHVVCPSIKLLDETGTYCGGKCTSTEGDCPVELWPQNVMPRLKNGWVHHWRKRYAAALSFCDAFITTSPNARDTILRNVPELPEERFHVIPHGRDFATFVAPSSRATSTARRVRILVPGNISRAKGSDIILALLDRDKDERLEFHVLGSSNFGAQHPRLILHGPYHRGDFAAHVERIAPDVGAVFSIWDETWCHTLTELWSIGLPAMVFDFPTIGGRVRESGAGWVYDHRNIDSLYASIVSDGFNNQELTAKRDAVLQWQGQQPIVGTVAVMASRYEDVYRQAMERKSSECLAFQLPN